ncbi:hypothetical protein ABPG74_022761 [Tetrahymena malaccensis]
MLTLETQKRIASLFQNIAENERLVEVVRQVLSEQEEFDPHSLFVKISGNKNYIIRKDITDFLDNFSVRYLPQEMNQLFYNYNSSKEKMNYTNFLKMILPNSSHFLRQLKVELIPHRRKVVEVTYELEWALIRVFEKELQLYRVVEVQKEEIMSRWDYKISAAFRCISQKSNKIHIEHGDLQNFIDLMGYSSTSDDILNILRRCDHDKDGKISQLDLELSLTPFKKYKTALIQQAAQAQQQEKKSSSTNLANSAVYNNSSSKKKVNNVNLSGSAQKESRNPSYSQNSNGFEQQKQAKSRSYSYQNGTQGNGYYNQQNEYQGYTNRSNQRLQDELNNDSNNINKTPRRQNSTDKMKQSSSIQRNSGKKSQLPQSSSTEINYHNNNNSNIHITPTKMKTISYSNNYNNNSYNNPSRGNSLSNNSTGTSQGFAGSQSKQNSSNNYKNQYSNQNIDPYRGSTSNQISSKKVSSHQNSDHKGVMNSSSGMKSYQNNNFQPLSTSKVTSKLNRSSNPKENINNSFLNYKEELKNQIKNEIFGQQFSNQKRSNLQQNNVYSQHESNTSYPDFQQQPNSQFSSSAQQPSAQKVLLLSNYHQNNCNSNQAKYENSSNKRYGELKQKLVDELNNSLVLSEKNSPTTQIYKKLKENLYSNSKNNHSTINYDSQYEMKNANQYGKEFKQKLREELSRSSQERRYDDLSSSKYNDSYSNYRHSPSPVRVIKVDVKDIDPLKQTSTIQSDKYNYSNNNSKLISSQPQTEKKQSIPQPLNNTLKEGVFQGYINNNTDEDINAVSRYYPSTEKKKLMQTQILNRESLGGSSQIYQQKEEKSKKYEKGIASPVRTSYQDNMKEYYIEKNKRYEIQDEIEKKMRQKLTDQQLNSRNSSYSPYKPDEILLRKQSIKEQQIIDQIEVKNEARNAEIKKIKEIEEKQLRELENIKQKQFLMEEERLNRLRKEEEHRKQQIEEELLRRERMKQEEEELERMQRLKKERERIREQDEKMQQAIRERMRIDDEIRMKQLKSQKIERDVQQLEQQLSRQASIERVKQYNQMEDFRRQQEIEIKQRELEKTRQIYEMQMRASAENTQRSPFRQEFVTKSNADRSSSQNTSNFIPEITSVEKNPVIQLQPVSLTTPKHQNDKTGYSQPQSNLKQVQFKQDNDIAAEQETKQRLQREIEQKRIQLELENQKAKEVKLAIEKQKKIQESMEESMLMEKKKQELILIEEIQKKKLQELEIERFKNEKLREIEEAENQRILALEKDLSYINVQKVNHFSNSFKPEESPTKAYEVVSKSNRNELNMSGTPHKMSQLNKSINNGSNQSPLESHIIKIFKFIIDSSNEIQNIKENLSMRADFTLSDAFRLMDIDQKGLIELPQFEQFLKSIDIHSSRESIFFLFNKLCPRNQKFLKQLTIYHFKLYFQNILKIIRKEDVDDIFKPISSDHSAILNNRVSLYNPRHPDFSKFTFETKDIISQLFKQLLNQEQKLEQMKSDFLHSKDFKLDDAYFLLDKEKNGYLSHDELKRILDSYHLCTVDKDIKNIFSRFDRYQRGKITFEDFRQEILPQSNYH